MPNIVSVYLVKFLGAGLSLVTPLLLAFFLEKQDLAFAGFVFSLVLFLSVFGSFGIKDFSIKTLPSLAPGMRRGCVGKLLFLVLVSGALTGFMTFAMSNLLYENELIIKICLGVAVFVMSVEYGISGINQVTGEIVRSVLPREVLFRLFVVVSFVVCSLFELDMSNEVISFFVFLSSILVLISSLPPIIRNVLSFGLKDSLYGIFRFISDSYVSICFIWFSSIIAVGFAHLDIIFVNAFSDADTSAEYYLASRIALGVMLFQWVQQIILGPFLAAHMPKKDVVFIQKKMRALFFSTALPAVLLVVLVLNSDFVFFWIYPDFSEESFTTLILMLLAWLFYVVLGPSDLVLLMGGELKKRLFVSLLSIIVLVFSLFLASYFDSSVYLGMATSVAIAFKAIVEFFLVVRLIGIEHTYWGAFFSKNTRVL